MLPNKSFFRHSIEEDYKYKKQVNNDKLFDHLPKESIKPNIHVSFLHSHSNSFLFEHCNSIT
jgi:hypothetical protein